VMVPNASGGQDEWSVECTSVNFMTRRGFTKHTIKAGDKISVSLTPLKDGAPGGAFRGVNSLNGAPLALESQD
jgi:outer membrane usher protein FimD/PapC